MDSAARRARSCRKVRHPSTGLNLLMAGADLLDGGTCTPAVSQRSEAGQGILCAKEGIGKYHMWYGVVCKAVMSSCMSAGCSLAGGRDTVPCLAMTAILGLVETEHGFLWMREEYEYGVGVCENTALMSDRYTIVNRYPRICREGKGLVVKKNQ